MARLRGIGAVMDARDWHAYCRSGNPDSPARSGQRDLARLGSGQLKSYSRDVEQYLLRCPARSPLHESLKEQLRDDVESIQLEPYGARTLTALTAPFTAGKSTTVKSVARELHCDWLADLADEERPRWSPPGREDVDADRIPIVYVNLQSDTSSKDLYAQILTFMGHGATWTRSQLAINTTNAFATHGVKLLILDDAHMLRTHLKQGQATLDAIKVIATELGEIGGMMCLVGSWSGASDLLDDPQVRGRLSLHELDTYKIGSKLDRALWQRLLKAWELQIQQFLPGLRSGDLSQTAARYLYERTQGYVGDLAKCLSTATGCALRAQRATLIADDLAQARLSARAGDHDGTDSATTRKQSKSAKHRVG